MAPNIRRAERILSIDESLRTAEENTLLEYLSEFLAQKKKMLDYADNHMQCVVEIIERIETEALRYPAYANLVHGYTYEQIEQTLTSGTALLSSRLSEEMTEAAVRWKRETDQERVNAFLNTEQLMDLPGCTEGARDAFRKVL